MKKRVLVLAAVLALLLSVLTVSAFAADSGSGTDWSVSVSCNDTDVRCELNDTVIRFTGSGAITRHLMECVTTELAGLHANADMGGYKMTWPTRVEVGAGVTSIDCELNFSHTDGYSKVVFLGDAPAVSISHPLDLSNGDITCYYPAGNTTWTDEVKQSYGCTDYWHGTLTWKSFVASGTCGDNLTWMLDSDGMLTISGTGAMDDSGVLANNQNIKSVYIEEGVTSIGGAAFCYCYDLASVSIPESVTSIGRRAFERCNSLTDITIPESVTKIGDSAFEYCESLTSVTIPAGVTEIGDRAFSGCYKLEKIEVDPNNTAFASVDGVLFNASKTTLILYPAGKTGDSYEIPVGVTDIGRLAFAYKFDLKSVSIPDGVTTIGDSAFWCCGRLVDVNIPSSVTSIGDSAFNTCNSLESVTIPEGVVSIGASVFSNCDNLTAVTIPESVTSIGENAFFCTPLTSIRIPKGVTSIGGGAFFSCENLTKIEVDPNNTAYTSVDGVLFNAAKTTLVCYPAGRPAAGYEIPDGVTEIGDSAFAGCSILTSATIPSGVTTIGPSGFWGCKCLTGIDLPKGVTSIGGDAFAYCSSLTTVSIPEGVTSIGISAFRECRALKNITIPAGVRNIEPNTFCGCSSLTGIVLPAGVTHIGRAAFQNCSSMVAIVIPVSVSWMEYDALRGCTALTDVFYGDDEERWAYVIQNNVDDIPETAVIHFNTPTYTKLVIALQPADAAAAPDNAAQFEVLAVGVGLTYQWQYRTSEKGVWVECDADGSRQSTLNVSANGKNHGWQYRCVITDAFGNSVASDAATLSVGTPLSITGQPEDVTVSAKDSATFTVVAEGEGLKYQWQYRTTETGKWTNNAFTTATMTFDPVGQWRNGYQYRCVVTDQYGATVTSNIVTLTVNSAAALKITAQPRNVNTTANGVATFTVVAEGDGLTYQWQYRSNPNGKWYDNAFTAATMTFNPAAQWRNGYQYRCVVADRYGSSVISEIATLTIGAPASPVVITAQPRNVTTTANGVAIFTVVAEGDGLTYQWQYRSNPNGKWYDNAFTTATMTFNPAAAWRNGYQYRCVVTDRNGSSVTSEIATLTIGAPASPVVITAQPRNVTTTANGVATFTVVAEGDGLTYQWQYRSNANSGWTSNAFTTATMTFNPVGQWRNGYQYRCVVTDKYGNSVISDIATLTVTAAPAVTIIGQPRSVTVSANESATFTVMAAGEGLRYQWQFRSNSGGSWTSNAFTTATMTFDPAGAWRNGYQYRCIVTDKYGNSVTSGIATLIIW